MCVRGTGHLLTSVNIKTSSHARNRFTFAASILPNIKHNPACMAKRACGMCALRVFLRSCIRYVSSAVCAFLECYPSVHRDTDASAKLISIDAARASANASHGRMVGNIFGTRIV